MNTNDTENISQSKSLWKALCEMVGREDVLMAASMGIIAALLVVFNKGKWLYELLPHTITPTAVLLSGCIAGLLFTESSTERKERNDLFSERLRALCMTYLLLGPWSIAAAYLFLVLNPDSLSDRIGAGIFGGIAAAGAALGLAGFGRLGAAILNREIEKRTKKPSAHRYCSLGFSLSLLPLLVWVPLTYLTGGGWLSIWVSILTVAVIITGLYLSVRGLLKTGKPSKTRALVWLIAGLVVSVFPLFISLWALWEVLWVLLK